jgi:hypothetical protein
MRCPQKHIGPADIDSPLVMDPRDPSVCAREMSDPYRPWRVPLSDPVPEVPNTPSPREPCDPKSPTLEVLAEESKSEVFPERFASETAELRTAPLLRETARDGVFTSSSHPQFGSEQL